MEGLDCHCGTSKEEIFDFVKNNEGEKIEVHYENNLYPDTWGDDDYWTYDTSNENELRHLNDTIQDCYIHAIKTVK